MRETQPTRETPTRETPTRAVLMPATRTRAAPTQGAQPTRAAPTQVRRTRARAMPATRWTPPKAGLVARPNDRACVMSGTVAPASLPLGVDVSGLTAGRPTRTRPPASRCMAAVGPRVRSTRIARAAPSGVSPAPACRATTAGWRATSRARLAAGTPTCATAALPASVVRRRAAVPTPSVVEARRATRVTSAGAPAERAAPIAAWATSAVRRAAQRRPRPGARRVAVRAETRARSGWAARARLRAAAARTGDGPAHATAVEAAASALEPVPVDQLDQVRPVHARLTRRG